MDILQTSSEQKYHIDNNRRLLKNQHTKDGYAVVDVPNSLFSSMLQKIHSPSTSWIPEAEDLEESLRKTGISSSLGGGDEDFFYPFSELYIHDHDPSFFTNVGIALQSCVEEWSQIPFLQFSNSFGPRKYRERSLLVPHVDRLPTHILSISLTIEYKVRTPWALVLELPEDIVEVYLEPGQMLLYEGAFISHSRPMPLDGDYYTNVYFHYYP